MIPVAFALKAMSSDPAQSYRMLALINAMWSKWFKTNAKASHT